MNQVAGDYMRTWNDLVDTRGSRDGEKEGTIDTGQKQDGNGIGMVLCGFFVAFGLFSTHY
jgi:hypothetical protein